VQDILVQRSMYFQEFGKKIEKTHPEWNIPRLRRAYDLSNEFHRYQKRKTGDPYIVHPVAVAKILYNAGGTEDMVCVAFLHDLLEDTNMERNFLDKLFGKRIGKIVDLLSKEKDWQTSYCRMKSNLDAMEGSWNKYPEAIIVKMADRLHNIQTLNGFLSPQKKQDCLIETKELFLPLFKQTLKKESFKPYFPVIRKLIKQLSSKVESQFKKFNIQYLKQGKLRIPVEEKETISILKYQGWKGVKQVYLEILEEAINKGEPILAFEKNEDHDLFRDEFFDDYIQKRFANKVKAYVINPATPANTEYRKNAEGEFTEIRVLDDFDFEENMNIVGDIVVTFSVNPVQGMIRKSRKEANTLKSLFWRTWKVSHEGAEKKAREK